MRVLVTGALGRIGRASVTALADAGHDVTATDVAGARDLTPVPGARALLWADLADAGDAFAVVRGHDVVVHAAAIPNPVTHPPHTVFRNNLMAAFNVIEASVRFGVTRLVNISSESVLGWGFAERPVRPDYLPVDEEHPLRPQDPYALAKSFAEQLCTAAVARSALRVISLRPAWVLWPDTYQAELGPFVRDPSMPMPALSYVDGRDVADAIVLAAGSEEPGHSVCYVVAPDLPVRDNLVTEARRHFGDHVVMRPVDRPDAAGTSPAGMRRLLGFVARHSWRDHVDA
ncbi:MAG TPA: NAD(P)-dependent oxidoreductase [Pseudonocardiaceae bacterium]|jgi:nucleoside-diphosphate-sugar epimerase|nr:NAD(P)-dependent oxidoreductase [Pseudonocardiaceae bacterium]